MHRYPKSGKGSSWTIKELEAITADWKRDTLSDGRGLSGEVRVASGGEISIKFKFAFRWQGKVTWFYCGTWPTTKLAEIRERRDKASQQLKEGIDPRDGRQAGRIEAQNQARAVIEEAMRIRVEALTVKDLFEAWVVDGVARKDGNAGIRRMFNKDVLPAIGARLVSELTELQIGQMLRDVVKRGRNRLAVMILTDLRQMFLWGEARKPWRKLLIDGNPATLVNIESIVDRDYDLTNERDRILSSEEIRELQEIFSRMQKEYESAANRRIAERPVAKETQIAIWICLSTTCRIGELLLAEWKHIDFDKREWHIPVENTKGLRRKKQPQTVFLSEFAFRQLQDLKKLTEKSRWCFPAINIENHVAVTSVTKQVGDRQFRFKTRKQLSRRKNDNCLVLNQGRSGEWTPHDLRRTAATLMQSLGVSLDVIDRCQNHVIRGSQVRRHYMHHDYAAEKREAWRLLGECLEKILAINGSETKALD